MPERTVPFRLYAQILIFSGLVALGALILVPIQRAIQGGMLGVRDDLITRLERRIDRKIQYSSISPSLFGSFDVRNVRIMGKDDQPVLTMSRFTVAYSLLDLLRGRVQAIHSVRIDTPLIDFDTARDQDLIELFEHIKTGDDGSPQNIAAMFPEKLMVRIRNGKILVLDGRDQFELDALNMNVQIADSRIILDGRWNVGATVDKLIGAPVSLYVAMRASGSCRTDMEEGEAVLSIPAVTGDAISASPIAFGFVLEDNVLRLGKMPDSLPFDFSLTYGIDEGNLDAQLDCTGFRLGELLSFTGGLESARQLLDIAGSGAVSFERRHDGSLNYSVDLAGTAPNADSRFNRNTKASFRINAEGDEQQARINTLRFSLPRTEERAGAAFFGDFGFSGSIGLAPFAPDGVLSLGDFSLSGTDGLSADIAIHTDNGDSGRQIHVLCETLSLGGVGLSDFNALLRPSEDSLDFTVSARRSADIETGAASDDQQAGTLALAGRMNTLSRQMEASLRVDSFSAGDLAGMTLPFTVNTPVPGLFRGLLGGTVITTEITVNTDFTHVSYNTPSFAFTSGAFTGLVSLSGTDDHFELNTGRFTWGDDVLLMSGYADFADSNDIEFSVYTNYRNIECLVEGEVLDGKSVNIHGPYGLNMNLAAAGGGYTGFMRADGFPVPFLGRPAFCSFAALIRYDTGASWSVNLEHFELTGVITPAGLAQVRASGSADQNGAHFPLYYRDALGPLSGRADFSWEADYSGFTGAIDMGEGAEHYHAAGGFSDSGYNLFLTVSSMRLDRVLNRAKALANGELRLSRDSSDDSFRAEFNLFSVTGRLYDQEFGATARAVLDDGTLTVSGFNFSFAGLAGEVPRFVINTTEGMAEIGLALQGLAGGRPIEGAVLVTADFKPVRYWSELYGITDSFDGIIHVDGWKYGVGGEAQTFDIAFSRSGGDFSVSGGPRNMIRFKMDQDGNFYGGLSSPFPVRGTVIGSVSGKTVDARCGDLYIDLAELFNVLPESPQFYLTGGYVNASVEVKGSITDPEFFGSARATSVRIRIPGFVTQELRPIPFTVIIDGNEIRFGPVSTAVGSGAGSVNGLFLIDRWIPNTFSIDIAVPRETPVPYGFDVNGFTARGDAFGNLNVSMENQTFDITGDLYANNTELGINHDEMSGPGSDGLFSQTSIPFVVNLTVTTGPVVEFFYPSPRFPILKANPDMGTKIHVTADSLAQQYTIVSDVRIRSGEIFYFERSFYIRSGLLTFRENELRFDPRLTARAEVRDRTEDGPVTISMIVDNAPLLSFTARFESTPSLSQMEILSLLGQNIAGAQLNENTDAVLRAFSNSVSDFAAQFYVIRLIEQQVRSWTRLDMFSVRTQLAQNLLFAGAERLMQTPVDRTPGVGNYFDNTTVFGGKYIGQDMFVQGMLTMRNEGERGLTFSPDIGVELQNPLFGIRWDFVPTHPENWYVNDNSITLTWTRTF